MSKFNLKAICGTILASGKKHAPELLTGGSLVLGWVGAYIFWKQSRKAEKRITYEENKLNLDENGVVLDIPDSQKEKLPVKDKCVIYLQYCYMGLIMGVGSTALCILSNRIQAERLLQMVMLTKFMTQKDSEKSKLIQNLEKEVGEKKVREAEKIVLRESNSTEDILATLRQMIAEGDTRTLIIDKLTCNQFKEKIQTVMNGIAEVNERLRLDREEAVRLTIADPFYVSDSSPYGLSEDSLSEKYSSIDLSKFLCRIGEADMGTGCDIGELLEFRYYGGSDLLRASDILTYDTIYKDMLDLDEATKPLCPEVCYLNYKDLLSPSFELMERTRI